MVCDRQGFPKSNKQPLHSVGTDISVVEQPTARLSTNRQLWISLRFVAAVIARCSGDKPDKEESAGRFRCYVDCALQMQPWLWFLQLVCHPHRVSISPVILSYRNLKCVIQGCSVSVECRIADRVSVSVLLGSDCRARSQDHIGCDVQNWQVSDQFAPTRQLLRLILLTFLCR